MSKLRREKFWLMASSQTLKMSKREKSLYKIKQLAIQDDAAKDLLRRIEQEWDDVFLRNPNRAPKYKVKRYNQLVINSELPFNKRKSLLIE